MIRDWLCRANDLTAPDADQEPVQVQDNEKEEDKDKDDDQEQGLSDVKLI